ncbi:MULTISPECIES: hypothetical protein [Aquimarina]|uniref:hypothetical protein n=1 Tax=Aquimarina TaxID=290174 RepID=UPI000D68CBBD|nr:MULTISPECIES: hypothetical protein [Aquimarina]
MKIDENLIVEYVREAMKKGYLKIVDHRKNILVIDDGVFKLNGWQQPKEKNALEYIFLEAFRLTRYIKFNTLEFERRGSRWSKKS